MRRCATELHIFACTAVIESGSENSWHMKVAYLNRGLAYFAMHDLDKAIADFGKALELSQQDANLYEARTIAFNAQQAYGRAIADDQMAVEINPRSARAYNNMANSYKAEGDLEKAIASYNRPLDLCQTSQNCISIEQTV